MPSARQDTAPTTVDTPFYVGKAVELGDVTVMFESFPQEQDATPFFRGLPDDRCPCPHWGLVVSGSWQRLWLQSAETWRSRGRLLPREERALSTRRDGRTTAIARRTW